MFKTALHTIIISLFLITFSTTAYTQADDTTNYQKITYEYDTVFLPPDTIRYVDTVYMYYEDTLQKKLIWQAEVFFSPFMFFDKYSFQTTEDNGYGQLFENSHSPELSYTYGVNINLVYKNLLFQTGINYTQFQEKFNYHSPTYLSFNTNIFIITDTLDTYYIVEGTDTTWFYITEENEYTQIDTIQNQNHFTDRNSYSYFEFPVVFGYAINKNRFSFLPKAGIIIGVLKQTKGKTINIENFQSTSDLNDLFGSMFTTIPLSMYFSLGIHYSFSKKVALIAEPYYRQHINSVYKNDFPVNRKIGASGVKSGLVIKI